MLLKLLTSGASRPGDSHHVPWKMPSCRAMSCRQVHNSASSSSSSCSCHSSRTTNLGIAKVTRQNLVSNRVICASINRTTGV